MADTHRTPDWKTEESYWRDNFKTRPYVNTSRGFDYYRPGYRFGTESATRMGGRRWEEAEPVLRRDWDRYEGRGESKWEDIKDSVKDAWQRVTGKDDRTDR